MYGTSSPWGSMFGAAAAPPQTPAEGSDHMATAAKAMPLLQALVSGGDATENVEVLTAKIANMKVMKRKIPALAFFYENEIRKLEGRLKVARIAQSRQTEGVEATRSWRTLGQAGIAVGVLVGVVAIALGIKFLRK